VNQLFLFFLREAKLTPLLSHHTPTFSIHALAINTILRSLCPLRCNPTSLFHTEANSAVKTKKRKKKRKETPVALAPPTRIRPSTGTTLSTSLTFSTTLEGTPAKGRCIDYLLPDPK
jgi:hypothetical protein